MHETTLRLAPRDWLIAAPILYGVPLLFPPAIASWRIVIYGVLLILVLLLKPEGFVTRRLVLSVETSLSARWGRRNRRQGGRI